MGLKEVHVAPVGGYNGGVSENFMRKGLG